MTDGVDNKPMRKSYYSVVGSRPKLPKRRKETITLRSHTFYAEQSPLVRPTLAFSHFNTSDFNLVINRLGDDYLQSIRRRGRTGPVDPASAVSGTGCSLQLGIRCTGVFVLAFALYWYEAN
jgi:hypothetical protein